MNLTLAVNALCFFVHLTNDFPKKTIGSICQIPVASGKFGKDQIRPNKTDLLTIADFHAEFQYLYI